MDKLVPAFETTLFDPTLSDACSDMIIYPTKPTSQILYLMMASLKVFLLLVFSWVLVKQLKTYTIAIY